MKKIIIIALFILIIAAGSVYALSLKESAPKLGLESNNPNESITSISASEVAKHNSRNDCWTIIENSIYEVTSYIAAHPGGDRIIQACGKDATELFKTQGNNGRSHSPSAETILERFKIGTLAN